MNIKKLKRIFNKLGKKKIFIFSFLIIFFSISLMATDAQATITELKYKPNVPLPITIGGYDFRKEIVLTSDGDFLASYMIGIYTYGAGFAGLIAMFMLVIAGWRWLLAGGNAQKVTEAKNIINGVLIGLALLFGGQLLLRQISEDFAYIKPLTVALPLDAIQSIDEAQREYCASLKDKPEDKIKCEKYDAIHCLANSCQAIKTCVPRYKSDGTYKECKDCPSSSSEDCSWYESVFLTNMNPCGFDRCERVE